MLSGRRSKFLVVRVRLLEIRALLEIELSYLRVYDCIIRGGGVWYLRVIYLNVI